MLAWYGQQVLDKVTRASVAGVNEVLGDCVAVAKGFHPPNVRTGTYQGSIRLEPARAMPGPVVVGLWGSWGVNYAIFLEKGTRYMEEYAPLRTTADMLYHNLAAAIRGHML